MSDSGISARAPTVLVYGDVDINLIDGSSVWLVSLCTVLDLAGVNGHVLLKASVERDVLSRELSDLARFKVWQPDDVGIHHRIRPGSVSKAIELIDGVEPLDIVIVRGLRATTEIAASGKFGGRLWPYLTDIPQSVEAMTSERRENLLEIFDVSARVLCQTEALRSFLVSYFPQHDSKMILLPPMVPDSAFRVQQETAHSDSLRLFYAGKLAPRWGIEEMLGAVKSVQADHPTTTISVAGDKIHDPADDPGYRERVQSELRRDGVEWLGGIDRDGVLSALGEVDLALSVRSEALDDSKEISTKLLEYAAAGVPTILNRTLAHQELLGDEYPLFVGGLDELKSKIAEIVQEPDVLLAARSGLRDVAAPYSISAVASRLRLVLESSVAWGDRSLDGRRVVVAGHDLRFAAELVHGLRRAGADVRVDNWRGGTRHDDSRSTELSEWADTIICEWCLANAEWYSRRKRAGQRLIVRFHRTEMNSSWPSEIDIGAVDVMVFVGDHIRAEAQEKFDWSGAKLSVIPNFVDTVVFDRPKLQGASFTLGMLGFLPQLKRMDRALDILESLRSNDQRFRLVFKGALPWELDWVWRDDTEREYFERQFDRIRLSPLLRDAVTFDRAGSDVASWLRKIGVVLSLSDIESFHMAMVEGMAARSIPVVFNREGVESIVESRWICESSEDAAQRILSAVADEDCSLGEDAHSEAVAKYKLELSARAWLQLL